MRIPAVSVRFVAYTVFGCSLLVIYQIVFMARTSANRDWNHLHSMKLTLADIQRFAVNNASNPQSFSQWPPYFHRDAREKSYSYISEVTSNAVGPVSVSALSPIFAFPKHKRSSKSSILQFDVADSLVCHHLETSIDNLVAGAIKAEKKAIVLEVNPEWIPNLGFTEPPLPIITIEGPVPHSDPFPFSKYKFYVDPFPPGAKIFLELAEKDTEWTMEYTIYGFSADTVIIGDSRGSPESTALFLEIARAFHSSNKLGWRPLRTVKFISFAHYSASKWANKHKSSLKDHVVAYLDCGHIPKSDGRAKSSYDNQPSFSVSPSLQDFTDWVITQMVEGGALQYDGNQKPNMFSSSFGGNTFFLEHGVSSVSTDFPESRTAAQFLTLLGMTLAQSPVLPSKTQGYLPFLNESCTESREFFNVSSEFDERISLLQEKFTEEFPWYQFKAKLAASWQRKHLNLIMQHFEERIQLHSKHPLFESGKTQTHTISRNSTCADIAGSSLPLKWIESDL